MPKMAKSTKDVHDKKPDFKRTQAFGPGVGKGGKHSGDGKVVSVPKQAKA